MYYNITIITIVVLFDIACIMMAWFSLQSPKFSELGQQVMALVFINCGILLSYAMAGILQS